jgi:hypothetical protein
MLAQLGITEEDWERTPPSARAALAQPVATAQQYVTGQSIHHGDETGWPEGERQKWFWVHATAEVTVTTLRQQGRNVLDYLTHLCSSAGPRGDGSICLLPEHFRPG